MKFCENCGQKLKGEDLYCPNCGKKVKSEVIVQKSNNEGLGTASMVIGIISLILAFFISVGIIPVAIIGLVLGIVNKAQKGKKISGIILNIIAILISIIVLIVIMVLFAISIPDIDTDPRDYIPSSLEREEVLGVWNCKDLKSITDKNKEYELTITINDDNTFIIADYKTPKDYVEGDYEFEESDMDRFLKSYKFYSLELEGKKEYKNGDYKGVNNIEYDMVITKTKKDIHAILNNDDIEKPYYCTK